MITGIDLRHRVHQLMVQLLRLVPRLLIKSKKNSSSSVVRLIEPWRFSSLYFSEAVWTIFLSVNLCRPFFHLGRILNRLTSNLLSHQVIFSIELMFILLPRCCFPSKPIFCFVSYGHTCQFFSFVFTILNHFYPVPTKIISVKNKDIDSFLRSKDSCH